MELIILGATSLIVICTLGLLMLHMHSMICELQDANAAIDHDLTAIEEQLQDHEVSFHELRGHAVGMRWEGQR